MKQKYLIELIGTVDISK